MADPRARFAYGRRELIVPGFKHHPGQHCGSTAFTDAVRFIGLDWSEAMVFGLASGAAFYLIAADGQSPSRMFHGRTGLFEVNFTEATGLDFAEVTTRDPDAAVAGVRAFLDRGEPVLIKSDIRYLPHYATEQEFNGHKVVVAGYEGDTFFIADTAFEGLQAIGAADLARAMSSAGAPIFWSECMYGPLRRSSGERLLREAIPHAIRRTSARMLEDSSGFGGQEALDRFGAELGTWRDRADAAWIARFGYQVIERRGTGGGMFRRLYARFLEEGQALADVSPALAPKMTAIADVWTELAAALRTESWDAAADRARRVADLERSFHEEVVR